MPGQGRLVGACCQWGHGLAAAGPVCLTPLTGALPAGAAATITEFPLPSRQGSYPGWLTAGPGGPIRFTVPLSGAVGLLARRPHTRPAGHNHDLLTKTSERGAPWPDSLAYPDGRG